MAEPVLQFRDVAFAWPDAAPLLSGLSLSVAPGECLALVGRNGAGKSTLFKLACGLLKPAAGLVTVGGLDTAHARAPQLARQVALMFQEAERQICHDQVEAEVAFAPRLAGLGGRELASKVARALGQTGLAGHARCHPFDLNAGERRLLTLAALIAQDTPLVLLDEPTRDFDAAQLACFEAWLALARSEGRALLFISHDLDFIARHASRVLHLGGGAIVADGPPCRVLLHPALQASDALPAPTLPALCLALGLPPTADADAFDAAWLARLRG